MKTDTNTTTKASAQPENVRQLMKARANFRAGDTFTNYDGRIGHRYAGTILDFETQEQGNQAMAAAGFTKDCDYQYLPCTVWKV